MGRAIRLEHDKPNGNPGEASPHRVLLRSRGGVLSEMKSESEWHLTRPTSLDMSPGFPRFPRTNTGATGSARAEGIDVEEKVGRYSKLRSCFVLPAAQSVARAM